MTESELDLSRAKTEPTTIAWCVKRDHPWSTYNSWLDRTWCRCGARQASGNQPIEARYLWQESTDCCDQPQTCTHYDDMLAEWVAKRHQRAQTAASE